MDMLAGTDTSLTPFFSVFFLFSFFLFSFFLWIVNLSYASSKLTRTQSPLGLICCG